jgi:hypothetical protein
MVQNGSNFQVRNLSGDNSKPSQKFLNGSKKPGSKKLPVVKLLLAVLGLALLVFGSKHLFTTASAKPVISLQPNTVPAVLGAQTQQNQNVPTTSSTPSTLQTTLIQTKPSPTPTTPAPTVAQNLIKITTTPTGYLNVRDQASLDGNIIGKVYPGATYTYTTQQGNWYLILLKSKRHGWIDGQYTVAVSQ